MKKTLLILGAITIPTAAVVTISIVCIEKVSKREKYNPDEVIGVKPTIQKNDLVNSNDDILGYDADGNVIFRNTNHVTNSKPSTFVKSPTNQIVSSLDW